MNAPDLALDLSLPVVVAFVGQPHAHEHRRPARPTLLRFAWTVVVLENDRGELRALDLSGAEYSRLEKLTKRHPFAKWAFVVARRNGTITVKPTSLLDADEIAKLANVRPLDLALFYPAPTQRPPASTGATLGDIADDASRLAARAISALDVDGSHDFQAIYSAHALAALADYMRLVKSARAAAVKAAQAVQP